MSSSSTSIKDVITTATATRCTPRTYTKATKRILIVTCDMRSHAYAAAKLAKVCAAGTDRQYDVTVAAPAGEAFYLLQQETSSNSEKNDETTSNNNSTTIRCVQVGHTSTKVHMNERTVTNAHSCMTLWKALTQPYPLPQGWCNLAATQEPMYEPLQHLLKRGNFDLVIPLHSVTTTVCDAVESLQQEEKEKDEIKTPAILLYSSLPYDPTFTLGVRKAWSMQRSLVALPHVSTYSSTRRPSNPLRYLIQLFWQLLDACIMARAWAQSVPTLNAMRKRRGLEPIEEGIPGYFRGRYPILTFGGVDPFLDTRRAIVAPHVTAIGSLNSSSAGSSSTRTPRTAMAAAAINTSTTLRALVAKKHSDACNDDDTDSTCSTCTIESSTQASNADSQNKSKQEENAPKSLQEWLDEAETRSIVYVGFGTGTILSHCEVRAVTGDLIRYLDTNSALAQNDGKVQQQQPRILFALRASEQERLRPVLDAAMGVPSSSSSRHCIEYINGRVRIEHNVPQESLLLLSQVESSDDNTSKVRVFLSHMGMGGFVEGVQGGVPFVCYPSGLDQYFNAQRAVDAGIGVHASCCLSSSSSSSSSSLLSIGECVVQVWNDAAMAQRARDAAKRLQALDGEGRALATIERIITTTTRTTLQTPNTSTTRRSASSCHYKVD